MDRNHITAIIYQNKAAAAHEDAARYLRAAMPPCLFEGYAIAAAIEQEAAKRFSALARAAMGIDDHPDGKTHRAGSIDALGFMADQFRIYADDNEELHRRYGTKGKAKYVASKRTQTFRDAADECASFASELLRDADG